MEDELGGKVMKKFVELRAKIKNYYLIDDGSEDKKAKGEKKVCHKKHLNLKIVKTVESTQLESKINHLEKMKLT